MAGHIPLPGQDLHHPPARRSCATANLLQQGELTIERYRHPPGVRTVALGLVKA